MYNLAAEAEVLGAILVEDNNLAICMDKINEFDFYDKKHQTLFYNMKVLYGEGKRINEINLFEVIGKDNIKDVGGISYISSLITIGLNRDLTAYLEIIKNCSRRRDLLRVLNRAIADLEKGKRGIEEIKENIYRGFDEGANECSTILTEEQFMFKALEEIEKRYRQGGDIQGIKTGFKSLDENLNGLKRGELTVVAGRPSMGKTVFALNLLDGLADNGYKVLLNELEMSEESIAMRILSGRAKIENKRLQQGKLTDEHFIKIVNEYQYMSKRGKAYIDFGTSQSLLTISAKAKTMKQTKGLDVVIVDYLGLMDIKVRDTRSNAIGELTRGLKLLAKELDISIVLLSQLSRGVEGRMEKRPMLSDLRDSGNIEQDADVVMFTYREKYYDKKVKDDKLELIVAKNRNGKTGTIKLDFYPDYQKVV